MTPVKRSSDPKGCHSPYVGNHCSKAVLNSSGLYCMTAMEICTEEPYSNAHIVPSSVSATRSSLLTERLTSSVCEAVVLYCVTLLMVKLRKKNLRLFAILDIYFTQLLQWSNYTCIYNPYTLCLDKKAFKNVDVIIIQIRV